MSISNANLNIVIYKSCIVEPVTIGSDVVEELAKLSKIATRMINRESMKVLELSTIKEGDNVADIATILVDDEVYYFVSNTSKDGLEDFLELRSSKFLEMSITLPSPVYTRFKAPTWREDLC